MQHLFISLQLFWLFVLTPLSQHTEHSWRKRTQRQTLRTTVRKWVKYCHDSKVCIVCRLSWWPDVGCFFPRETANFRTETATADMRLCQRRRRTWQCSGGEGSALALSSVIKLHSRWTVWKRLSHYLQSCASIFESNPSCDLFFIPILSLCAGTLWTSCWKLKEPTLRSCSVYYRC